MKRSQNWFDEFKSERIKSQLEKRNNKSEGKEGRKEEKGDNWQRLSSGGLEKRDRKEYHEGKKEREINFENIA